MSRMIRSPILNRVMVCAAVGLTAVGWTLFGPMQSPARSGMSADAGAQDPYGQDPPIIDPFGQLPGDGMDGFDALGARRRERPRKRRRPTSLGPVARAQPPRARPRKLPRRPKPRPKRRPTTPPG